MPPEVHVHPPDQATEALTMAVPVAKSPRTCIFVPRQCAAVSTKWRLMIEPEHEAVPLGTLAVIRTAQGAWAVAVVPFQTAPAGVARTATDADATAAKRRRGQRKRRCKVTPCSRSRAESRELIIGSARVDEDIPVRVERDSSPSGGC
jgi:hypothetical protein